MCGIIGQISFTSNTKLPNLDLLQHRGPDGSGDWINENGNIYLGHTRLAILEPTPAGRQPMKDKSTQFTITFNGEIYNHIELRSLLPGIIWNGNSDTETLVELLAAKGLEALSLLKGMFAFALHDSKDDSVLLVRDRLGIKPLWICHHEKAIRFSSEVRALSGMGESKLTVQALSEYVSFGRMPNTGEIFEGIKSIPPGSWLKIKNKENIEQGDWWPNNNFLPIKPKNNQECSLKIKQLVTTAIEEHLISDVGVGSFLSGGIDSSIVTLVAGKILGHRLRTFTVGFPQKTFDERSIAKMVAKKAGSEHTELEIKPETCLTWVQDAVSCLDLPSVDAINTYIVSKAVRDTGVKVALSGLGGDELFGGYPSFRDVPFLSTLNFLPVPFRKKLINYLPNSIKEKFGELSEYNISNLTTARRRFSSVANLKNMGLNNGEPSILFPPKGLDRMSEISWAEIQNYMIPMLLRDSDQMSMAVGLEIRVPFLDHVLVENVLKLPQKFKKGSGVKPLLINAFINELPIEVYNRPKQGFALPMNEWISGPLAEFTREGVLAAADYLSLSEPLKQLENFSRGDLHWTRLWKWSVLGHWLNRQNKYRLINSN